MGERPTNEQVYFDRLKRIAKAYQTTDQLRRNAERDYGLDYTEALEMAYENIQSEAASAIKGKRRPKAPTHPSSEGRAHG